jgi:hypothetical protein
MFATRVVDDDRSQLSPQGRLQPDQIPIAAKSSMEKVMF